MIGTYPNSLFIDSREWKFKCHNCKHIFKSNIKNGVKKFFSNYEEGSDKCWYCRCPNCDEICFTSKPVLFSV